MKTTVVFVLDETGSMGYSKDETISGFNAYIGDLKKSGKKYSFYLTCFNSSKVRKVYDGVSIKRVKPLTDNNYFPAYSTPLLDAVGDAINSIETKRPVLFIIMTDGYENASHEYSADQIKEMISKKTEDGWTFVYLGADHDAWGQASSFGLSLGNTIRYAKGDEDAVFSTLSCQTMSWGNADGKETKTFWDDA